MQRRRASASPRAAEDALDAYDDADAKAERWARVVAHRDRQLRGAVLMQRSMRRYLNRTYERDACARTIQRFVRRYVLSRRVRGTGTLLGRRRENATMRPSTSASAASPRGSRAPRTPRGVRTTMVFEDGYAMGYAYRGGGVDAAEEDDDDDGHARWGKSERRRADSRGERWRGEEEEGGGGERGARNNYLQSQGEITRSTAPLTGSQVTVWADFHSSSTSSGSSGRSLASPHHGGPTNRGIEYEVFVWQNRQHELEVVPCVASGFPSVVDAARVNISLPGMWNVRDGDLLISINDYSTHRSEMPMDDVEQILENGVRPAVLRFRRPCVEFGSSVSDNYQRRDRAGLARPMSMASVRSTTGGGYGGYSSSSREEIRKKRERTESSLCYVIFREEDESLGLKLDKPKGKPYPEVSVVRNYGAAALAPTLSPRVNVGDMLLSINDWSVRQARLEDVVNVLRCSPRPLVLTFRRLTPVYRTFEL